MPLKLQSSLIALGFVVCWSSGFVGGRLAVEATTPVLVLFAWRFLLAGLATGLWWALCERAAVGWRELFGEAGVGALTMGGYLLCVILAIEFGVSTGVTALIAALQPLLAAALAGPWLGERLTLRGWLGMGIATLGVVVAVFDDMSGVGGAPPWAYALPLLAVVSVTLGSIIAAGRSAALPMSATLTAQLAAATVVFAGAAVAMGQAYQPLPSLDSATLTAIGWLILFSTLGGYGFFVASLRRLGVTLTSTLVYLTPPVTLIWAAFMFGERPGLWGVVGTAVAIVGVGLALFGTRRRVAAKGAAHAAPEWSARRARMPEQ